jgi:hypothetical protein
MTRAKNTSVAAAMFSSNAAAPAVSLEETAGDDEDAKINALVGQGPTYACVVCTIVRRAPQTNFFLTQTTPALCSCRC